MTKAELIKSIQDMPDDSIMTITSIYNKNWKYPQQGDDQASCPMLDFMFNAEYKGGHLIFIQTEKHNITK